MAKYIIEIPDGTVYGYDENKKILIFPEKDFIEASEVSNLIYLPNVIPYEESIDNGFYNTAWTDGYEKGVEAGRNDAWEFVTKCLKMDGNDFYEIFDSCDALYLTNLSYQEAKDEYEAWKKSKEEIHVGDEVIYNSRTRAVVLEPENGERYGTIFTSEFSTIVVSHDELEKTGRHFDEVEELLKKIREESNED